MVFIILGTLTAIAVIIFIFALIGQEFALIGQEVGEPWRACGILVFILWSVWFPASVWQINIWNTEEAEATERKAYYDKCIVETDEFVNNKKVSHTYTDTCLKK